MNETLREFREEVDEFMQYHPQSPLDDDQRVDFDGLAYYDFNPDLALEVAISRLPDDELPVAMDTSTGDTRLFRRYGTFDFEVDGRPARLTLYSDTAHGSFFLPFRDATSGGETYGAGRYLDDHRPGIERLDGDRFRIDFNYAYNPYCAYAPRYSCPLPPMENWLKVAIRAGERDFMGG